MFAVGDSLQSLNFIYEQSKGDLRSGIHLLQNSHMIYQNDPITQERLQGITMVRPVDSCHEGDSDDGCEESLERHPVGEE